MKIIGANLAKISTDNASDMQNKFATSVPGVVLRDSRPLFTVYYRIDPASTVSAGFSDVNSTTGDSSPVRYNLIKDLALFGRSKIEVDPERSDELGLDAQTTNFTVELPPGIFEPKEGEFFSYQHEKHHILYRVNKVSADTVHNNPTYILDCDIKYMSAENETIDMGTYLIYSAMKDQLIGTYTAVYENIGTDASVIIADDDMTYIKTAQAKIVSASSTYLEIFMNHDVNNLLFDDEGTFKYSNFLNRFINECDSVVNYENELFLSLDLPKGRNFDRRYKTSFYTDILNRKKFGNYDIKEESYSVLDGVMMYYSPYMVIDKDIKNTTSIDTIIVAEGGTSNLGVYHEIIKKYYDKESLDLTDLDVLNTQKINQDLETFVLLPLVIAIVRADISGRMKNNYIYHDNNTMSRRF